MWQKLQRTRSSRTLDRQTFSIRQTSPAQLEKLLTSDCRAVFLLFPCLGLFMLNQTTGGLLCFSGSYCKACCGCGKKILFMTLAVS